MRVSGATILNDAVRLGYPFRESLASLLPLVDELVVNVGPGDDGTWEAVAAMRDERIKPFRSAWDLSPRGGAALSEESNRALARCGGDWVIYLQADEVLHEDDAPALREALARHLRRPTEGLVFDYLHFFASGHVVSDDWFAFYPRAVRAVKRASGVESCGDAAGFVRRAGGRSRGLLKARAHARVFHYGWCDTPELKAERATALTSFYRPPPKFEPEALIPRDLTTRRDLRYFRGTHPGPMRPRFAPEPAPALARPFLLPGGLRAWARFLASPVRTLYDARPFLPLWLTNLHWRLSDLRTPPRG